MTIQYVSGFSPTNPQSCGNVAGNTVTLFEKARTPDDRLVSCTNPAVFSDTVTHELGHTIGLMDISASNCRYHIMAQVRLDASGNYVNRSLQSAECAVARETNRTPAEDALAEFCPPFDTECTGDESPIVLDIDGNGFHLVGPADAVFFDIDADGMAERLAWTAAGHEDAFLARDRNGNGIVDDGSELFGNWTPLADGTLAPHGYVALAELDEPRWGGNGNGSIEAQDALYGELRLWIDANHDGLSEPGELRRLDEAGVVAISLDYVENRRRDRHGNLFRFNSRAWISRTGRTSPVQASDVFFRLAP